MQKTGFNALWQCRELPGGAPFAVTLPHDQSILKQRSPLEKTGSAGGFFPAVDLEYTKEFSLPRDVQHAFVCFDGTYQNAEVYLDGIPVAREPHGYVPFLAPVGPGDGETHKLRVTLASGAAPSSRWYAGSGIYREVFLLTGGEVCFDPRGAYVTPVALGKESYIRFEAPVLGAKGHSLTAALRVADRDGNTAAEGSFPCQGDVLVCSLPLPEPKLWSPDEAYLYSYTLTLFADGVPVDSVSGRLGFRSLALDREKGLLLNGTPLKLRGGCVHHDNGLLGAAALPDAERRKARLLRQNGFNAVRCAHNPPSSAFLDACDEEGLIVIDEFTDMWNWGKNPYDYHLFFDAWWERDLTSMILRDRSHPCVAFWSIGNEIPERDGSLGGYAIARNMCALIRKLDPTRFITSGLNNISPRRSQMLEANLASDAGEIDCFDLCSRETLAPLDAAGYNYLFRRYEKDLAKYPDRFILGTESVALEVRETEKAVRDNPRVLGDFIWSAIDYLGEAGLGHIRAEGAGGGYFEGYPWRLANCGDLDICGVKRPQSYLRDAVWGRLEKPYLSVQPPWRYAGDGEVSYWAFPERYDSWDFGGWEGKPVRVYVYSDAACITLLLNGSEIAQSAVTDNIASFSLSYEPGTLQAVDSLGRSSLLRTPEGKNVLTLQSDISAFERIGRLCYIDISLTDKDGTLRCFEDARVSVSAENAELLALGSASPVDEEGFGADCVRLYRGRAQAILRCTGSDACLRASAPGLGEACLMIPFRPPHDANATEE